LRHLCHGPGTKSPKSRHQIICFAVQFAVPKLPLCRGKLFNAKPQENDDGSFDRLCCDCRYRIYRNLMIGLGCLVSDVAVRCDL
jgi:hypothetical protein